MVALLVGIAALFSMIGYVLFSNRKSSAHKII
jgi:hypothetical protein